jgi:hypothetical protein
LEHLANYVEALTLWRSVLKVPDGVLFLYLPHPAMEYWRPANDRKHVHEFTPALIVRVLKAIGFKHVFHGERDLNWSFSVVATT